jgi:hypothetical protein
VQTGVWPCVGYKSTPISGILSLPLFFTPHDLLTRSLFHLHNF